jgi:rubrerythrin
VSRIPRHLEYLKTGSTAEAVAAARFRAYAARAERDGHTKLAGYWRELATAKDALAIQQLEAAGQILGGGDDLAAAVAEERYENDVLYPKLLAACDHTDTAKVIEAVVAAQKEHLGKLAALRDSFNAAPKDPRM